MFAAVVVGGLAFPSGIGGYTAQYLWVAAGAVVLLLTQRLRPRPEAVVLGGVVAVLGLASAILVQDIWQVREYVRVALFAYLFVVLDEPARQTALRAIVIAVAGLITFDFVVLYLLDVGSLKTLLYQRGMRGYVDHYWRHVGVLGNPNSSAALYAIAIVAGTASVLRGLVHGRIRKIFVAYSLAVSALLLPLTLSRTAIIATAGAVLAMVSLRFNRTRELLLGVAFVLAGLIAWSTNAWGVQTRFESLTSLVERVSLWRSLLGSVTAGGLIAGSGGDISVVDNDLVYFIQNFGLFGTLANYLVVVLLLVRMWLAGLRTEMAGLGVLVLLLGIGMGFFADPKFGLLIFAGIALVPPVKCRETATVRGSQVTPEHDKRNAGSLEER